ncbi:hypothetical protein HDV02_000220, partial [Globomyces sp. JEL0801]
RCLEYHEHLSKVTNELEQVKNGCIKERHVEYQKGVIGVCQGLNSSTNSKTIKKLMEMVAPVAFVDYQRGNTYAYIRFKSHYGLLLAQSYYSRTCITQKNGYDCTGALQSAECKQQFYNFQNDIDSCSGIVLYGLDGADEAEYWETIYSVSGAEVEATITNIEEESDPINVDMYRTVPKLDYKSPGQNCNLEDPVIKSEEPMQSKPKKVKRKAVHITFEDSDTEMKNSNDTKLMSGLLESDGCGGHNKRFKDELSATATGVEYTANECNNTKKSQYVKKKDLEILNIARPETAISEQRKKRRHRSRR